MIEVVREGNHLSYLLLDGRKKGLVKLCNGSLFTQVHTHYPLQNRSGNSFTIPSLPSFSIFPRANTPSLLRSVSPERISDKELIIFRSTLQMLTELPLPNKSTPSSSLHSVSSFISDYGIQVGISFPASDDGLSCEERRKLKKKQARKRRKEKSKEAQRQARRQIAAIVQQFYSGETSFAQREKELQGLIEVAYSSDFHDFLDEMIRSRVTLQQRQIWEYTQEILEERHFEREEISFYRLMVMHIYGRWRGIQTASAQIEPMINIYLRYSYPQRDQELAYRNLAVNTFNYMLDTDETLKNLVRICDRRISFLPSEERSRLDEMVGLMDNYEDQDEQGYGCMVGDELHSTAHSEQEEREGQQRRRRKKKVKESDLSCEIQAVMKRLSSLVIKEERGECRVSEQDLTRWKKRRQDYLKS